MTVTVCDHEECPYPELACGECKDAREAPSCEDCVHSSEWTHTCGDGCCYDWGIDCAILDTETYPFRDLTVDPCAHFTQINT